MMSTIVNMTIMLSIFAINDYSAQKKFGKLFLRVNNFFLVNWNVMKRHTLKQKHVFSTSVRFCSFWISNVDLSNDWLNQSWVSNLALFSLAQTRLFKCVVLWIKQCQTINNQNILQESCSLNCYLFVCVFSWSSSYSKIIY